MTEGAPPKKGMSKGCKITMIIGLIVVAIIIIGIVLSFLFCNKLLEYGTNKAIDAVETQVLSDLPDGFDEREIKSAFVDFKEAMKKADFKDGKLGPAIQKLTAEFQTASSDGIIDEEELTDLLGLMKDFKEKVE